MNNRENVLRALRRQQPQRVPFEFVLCPYHFEQFKARSGHKDYMEYYGFPIRYIDLNPTRRNTDFSVFYDNLPKNAMPLNWNPEWGVMGTQGSIAHFQEMLHPMASFSDAGQIHDYPFPDFAEEYRWDGFELKVAQVVKRELIAVASMQMTIFEVSWYLRGMDRFMMDMVLNPEFADTLMDKITEIRIEMARRYALAGVDILMLGDDVSTQEAMMISPQLWREKLKPRLAKIIKAAKNNKPDILVFYHGDGNCMEIISDLIEIGIDVLNPVQPECMDPMKVKELYGDRLSLWGTLGTQSIMPFGTPAQVKQKCKELIETVGKGGGLLLAPTHMIEPDVPWENVQAFIDAVKEYGQYIAKH
jgi:uroporphyrinogen decarboxylase